MYMQLGAIAAWHILGHQYSERVEGGQNRCCAQNFLPKLPEHSLLARMSCPLLSLYVLYLRVCVEYEVQYSQDKSPLNQVLQPGMPLVHRRQELLHIKSLKLTVAADDEHSTFTLFPLS